jgi:hypothetical protein
MAPRNGTARFEGKAVLVTGASSGIGRATALAFGREGAKVVVAARRDDEGEETARAIRDAHGEAHFVRADVTREVEVAALVEQMMSVYGRLDVAFNNAGLGGAIAPLTELAEETWHDQIAGNLTSVFLSMKHEIPAMLQGGGGSIVNTASVLGLVGIGGIAPYVAAKHGVSGSPERPPSNWRSRASASTPSPRLSSTHPSSVQASAPPRKGSAGRRRSTRSAVSAPRKRSRRLCSTSPPTRPRSSPGPRCPSMAAGQPNSAGPQPAGACGRFDEDQPDAASPQRRTLCPSSASTCAPARTRPTAGPLPMASTRR